MKNRIIFLLFAALMLLTTGCSTLSHTKSQQSGPSDVSSQLVPVSLYTDDEWAGSGTLLLAHGKPDRIVTSGHIFWKGFGPRIYEYRAIGSDLKGFISNVNPRPLPEATDLAICELGDPQLTGGNSDFEGGGEFTKQVQAERFKEPILVTSRSTGEKSRVIGSLLESNGVMNYVITHENPIAGQSGSGFFDHYGRLYVLRSYINATEAVRKFFFLPEGAKTLTVAVAVTLTAAN